MEQSEKKTGSCLGRGLLVVFAIFVVLIIGDKFLRATGMAPQPTPYNRADEITKGCEREFPYDVAAQRECFTTITVRELEQAKQDKIDRAAR